MDSNKSHQHAQILRAMSEEWRANDDLSEAMLDLALRVYATRNSEEAEK